MYNSKAEQKRDLNEINKKYDKIKRKMENTLLMLEVANKEKEKHYHNLYWKIPNYVHQWNKNKIEMFNDLFTKEVDEILYLKEMKETIINNIEIKGMDY